LTAKVSALAARRAAGPRRGQVYWLDIPDIGRRPWLVVSANGINQTGVVPHVIAARISTVVRDRHLPTVVRLGPDEPIGGCVLAATVMQVRRDWFVESAGVLTADTMRDVDHALGEALGLI
jgi:mRNA-degrading endonuclease toxin of MazEF toxin-antitoxin module